MTPVVPTITIVTPTLNAAQFITGCLANVHAQGYPALEHLLVDGGSSDQTIELARSCGSVQILQFAGLKQSGAINAGLRAASGEIVAWLNADDRYVTGTLDYVGQRFAADGGLDALFGDCDVVNAKGRLLWREIPGAYDYQRLLKHGNYLAQPAVFLKKSLLDRIGYLDESFDFGMDYELWFRLRGNRVEYVPRILARYTWHPGSKTARNQWGNWRELIQVVRRHGGGWTPSLAWAFSRMLITVGRTRAQQVLAARFAK
jgi:glycosyltransferase involved in cell wall biosynthesis